jgi:hypothetical protein
MSLRLLIYELHPTPLCSSLGSGTPHQVIGDADLPASKKQTQRRLRPRVAWRYVVFSSLIPSGVTDEISLIRRYHVLGAHVSRNVY